MTTSQQQRRSMFGVGASIAIHLCVLGFVGTLLFQPPTFATSAGRRANAIALTMVATPQPTPVPPPLPTPPVPPPPAPPVPQGVPVLTKTVVIIPPAPVPQIPPMHIVVQPKPAVQPPHPHVASHQAPVVKDVSSSEEGPTTAVELAPIFNPAPAYPDASTQNHEQGTVTVHIEVTASGDVGRVSVLRSSGYARLDRAAVEAVKEWKFHPATVAGIPVAGAANEPVQFQLPAK